jgi:hypothetical protein
MGADGDRFLVSMPVGRLTFVDEAQSKILFANSANAGILMCSVSLPQSVSRSLSWANPQLQTATQVRA